MIVSDLNSGGSQSRSMLKSKVHRATVTDADLEYEGSLTLDSHLMTAADILPFEEVHVWNVTRGTRLTTYVIPGEAHSGTVCINGAAAHLVSPGDMVIIASFVQMDEKRARTYRPRLIFVDEENRIQEPAVV